MDKIKLNIVALAHSENQQNSFIVVLKEEDGERRLPVVIGGFEAQAIALAAEGIKPNRPMTHDLLFNTLRSLNIELEEVAIVALRNGIFFASLNCTTLEGDRTVVDSRTSDALALAMRFQCPIYTNPDVMDEAGVLWKIDEGQTDVPVEIASDQLDELPVTQLEKLLERALADEDYERAAEIRDEMKRRDA